MDLEPPIELARLGHEGALEVEHELVQHRLVRAVVEEPAEVLIIVGTAGIGGDPAFDPAGNGQARFRFFLLDELGLGRLFLRSQGLRDCAAGREQNEKADNERRESYHPLKILRFQPRPGLAIINCLKRSAHGQILYVEPLIKRISRTS